MYSLTFTDRTATLVFSHYTLDDYAVFLQAKTLPEYTLTYDWRADTYTITTPARFAGVFGVKAPDQGHTLPLAPHLFDYQAIIVAKALEARRYAVWLDTGLGKTAIFLEWCRHVVARAGQGARCLILSPLGIIPQTIAEAARFYGGTLPLTWLRTRESLDMFCQTGVGVAICNYEKLIPGVLDSMHQLDGIALDEASMLKSSGGVIKWNVIKSSRGVQYKLACTATPAPNDSMEFASQASFLEKLNSEGEVLWTFFSRDKYGNWSIKPHARQAFYTFLASWSIYLRNPARFGWKDILGALPPPDVRVYQMEMTDEQRDAMYKLAVTIGSGLFNDEHLGVKERIKFAQIARGFLYTTDAKGKRHIRHIAAEKPAMIARVVQEDVADGRQVIVWTVFDEEAVILESLLPGMAVGILHGKMDEDDRLDVLHRFQTGLYRVLITKPQLAGYGMNFQHCTSMVFSGIDDSFERFYQSVRRAYRYGQTEVVKVHVPFVPSLEGHLWDNIQGKEAAFMRDASAHEDAYFQVINTQGSTT